MRPPQSNFGWMVERLDTFIPPHDLKHDRSIPGEKYPPGTYAKKAYLDIRHEQYCAWLHRMTQQTKVVPQSAKLLPY